MKEDSELKRLATATQKTTLVRKQDYPRALGEARVIMALNTIEHKVRTDPQLTRDDGIRLLGDVEGWRLSELTGGEVTSAFRGVGQRTV